jgi:hypothetical protein
MLLYLPVSAELHSGAFSERSTAFHQINVVNDTAVTVHFQLADYDQELITLGGEIFNYFHVENGYPLLDEGSPDLERLQVTLPENTAFGTSVKIISQKFTELDNIEIKPFAGITERAGNHRKIKKSEVYRTDSFYPATLIEAGDPFIIRNSRSRSYFINLFQYNPVSKKLRIYTDIVFQIVQTDFPAVNQLTMNDLQIHPIEDFAPEELSNPIKNYSSGQLPPDDGAMLIICPDKYRSAILPLANWKIKTGLPTEIVSANQFETPTEIYSFVKNYYQSKGNLSYLLLVGDGDDVPPYMYQHGASDNYYSYLSGNDHYPDIMVGRFSAESAADVEVQVNRTLEYEQYSSAENDWLSSAMGLASTLAPGDDGEADFEHVRSLLQQLKANNYNRTFEFFDGSQGGNDQAGNPKVDDVMAKVNDGAGVIFYTGHGSPNSWATGSLSKAQIEELTNYSKYPVIWSAACETGNFASKYCLAEAWLRARKNNKPTGALAALMATSAQSSYPPMEAQDKIAEIMAGPIESIGSIGSVAYRGMISMNDVYGSHGYLITDTWVLFGDPSVKLRTGKATPMMVKHSGSTGIGRSEYKVECVADNATLCISQNGNILSRQKTIAGDNIIQISEINSVSPISITITAPGYIPYIDTIIVKQLPDETKPEYPVNHSRMQPINTALAWDCQSGGKPDYYLLYLGTDFPPSNILNGVRVSGNSFTPDSLLSYSTGYYWKAVPVNEFGNGQGKIFDFTTVTQPDEDFEPDSKHKTFWKSTGNQPWEPVSNVSFDGSYSLRSGQIGDAEQSSVYYNCEVSGCDFVGFWFKTDCSQDDELRFLIDDQMVGNWSGNNGWIYASFMVPAGSHKLEWSYVKDSSGASGYDAVWIDNIHLPLHNAPVLELNEIGSVCENSLFESVSQAENYFTLTWNSTGDGYFSDENFASTYYLPGANDKLAGRATLTLSMQGFGNCPAISKTIDLIINKIPEVQLPGDTIVTEGKELWLDAENSNAVYYEWMPGNVNSPHYLVDSLQSKNGLKTISVKITDANGCSSTHTTNVHFNNPASPDIYQIYPNPNFGTFNIVPQKGTAVINQMFVFDQQGKVVWRSNETTEIIGSRQITLPSIPGGTYYFVTGNKYGYSKNAMLIQ